MVDISTRKTACQFVQKIPLSMEEVVWTVKQERKRLKGQTPVTVIRSCYCRCVILSTMC